jgi:hypothetical protein
LSASMSNIGSGTVKYIFPLTSLLSVNCGFIMTKSFFLLLISGKK